MKPTLAAGIVMLLYPFLWYFLYSQGLKKNLTEDETNIAAGSLFISAIFLIATFLILISL